MNVDAARLERRVEASTRRRSRPCRVPPESPPQTRRPNPRASTIESSTTRGRAARSARIAPRIERSRPRRRSPMRRPRSALPSPAAGVHGQVPDVDAVGVLAEDEVAGRGRTPRARGRQPARLRLSVPSTTGVSGLRRHDPPARQRRREGLRRRRRQAVGGLEPDLDVGVLGARVGRARGPRSAASAFVNASSSVLTMLPVAVAAGSTTTTTRAAGSPSTSPASAPSSPATGRCQVARSVPVRPEPSSTAPRARSTTASSAAGGPSAGPPGRQRAEAQLLPRDGRAVERQRQQRRGGRPGPAASGWSAPTCQFTP